MPRVSKDWPSDLTKRLIREYEKRPEMWKSDHPYYNNRLKQQENLCQLAKLLNKTETNVKNKIRGLRTTFFKEFSTQRLSQTYTTKWEYYGDLKFVQSLYSNKFKNSPDSDCDDLSNKSNTIKTEDDNETSLDQSTQVKYKNLFCKENNRLVIDSQVIVDDEFAQPVCRTIKINSSEEDRCPELVHETNNKPKSTIDDCQHFGNFIASEIRDMSLSKRKVFKNDVLRSLLNNY